MQRRDLRRGGGGTANIGRGGRAGTHLCRQKRKAAVCLCAHNVSVHPLKHCKWEKYAWVSQVTGLRGHIIDPFGGKMTAL